MFSYKAHYLRSAYIYIISIIIIAYTVFQSLCILPFISAKNRRRFADQCIQDWARRITKLVNIDLVVKYQTPITWEVGKRYIILSNHASLYDIPLLYLALPPSIRMLAKKELSQIPFFGRGMKNAEFIFIDRQNLKHAIKDLELAKEKLNSGIKLWMAPEGTRSRSGKLLSFKKGPFMVALEAQATIIPVGIRGSNKVLPPKTLRFNMNQRVEIIIGEPIDTKEFSIETRDALVEKLRHVIAHLSGETLDDNIDANKEK